jgi:RNA polymerase sigma-70 factor (ECF subfamily)
MEDIASRFTEHIPALRRYARVLAGDPARADDLVQDCLERALSRRHLWRRPGNLRGWLFTIMHNVHVNHVRAARRAPIAEGADPADHAVRDADQIEKVAAAEVARAIELLPYDQRQVLALVAIEGMRYEEAAALLEVPVGTIMSRLSRARARLREITRPGARIGLWRVK